MKGRLKWARAVPIIKPDNIMSSKAREIGDYGFKPKFEDELQIKMGFIMSNEYQRLWEKERDLYQKDNMAKQEEGQKDASCKRRYVQRIMTSASKPVKKLPLIQIKKFQNIPSKVDHTRPNAEGKTQLCKRYVKSLEKNDNVQYKTLCVNETTKERNSTQDVENFRQDNSYCKQ